MARYPTRQVTSAGGLVYEDRADGRWVVLIAHRNSAGKLQWTLPKGGLEEDETFAEAALREVEEETGLVCHLVRKLGVVDYWFVWKEDRVRYHKFVHYFLMTPKGGSLDERDDEADEVAWVSLSQALARLSYPNERRLVAQADPTRTPLAERAEA